jgi:hypothetical protein
VSTKTSKVKQRHTDKKNFRKRDMGKLVVEEKKEMRPEEIQKKVKMIQDYDTRKHKRREKAKEYGKDRLQELAEVRAQISEFNEDLYRAKKAARKSKNKNKDFVSEKQAKKLNKRLVKQGKEPNVVATTQKKKVQPQAGLSVHAMKAILSSPEPYQALGVINQKRAERGKKLYPSYFIDDHLMMLADEAERRKEAAEAEAKEEHSWFQTLDDADKAAMGSKEIVALYKEPEGVKTRKFESRGKTKRIKKVLRQLKKKEISKRREAIEFAEPTDGAYNGSYRGGDCEHPNARRQRQKKEQRTDEQVTLASKNSAAVKVRQAKNSYRFKNENYKRINAESLEIPNGADIEDVIARIAESFYGCDDIVQTVGPIVTYLYQLFRSRNYIDGIAATYQFYSVFANTGVVDWMREAVKRNARALIQHFLQREIESESWSDTLVKGKNLLVKVCTGEVAKAARDLVLAGVSFRFFSKDVSQSLTRTLGKPEKMDLLSLISHTFDHSITLLRVGEALVAGVPFDEILVAKNPVEEVTRAMDKLLYYSDKLYTGLPVDGMYCRQQFMMDAKKLITISEHLEETQNKFTSEGKLFHSKLTATREALFNVRQAMNGACRQTPYAILLYGDPGIGKGELVPFLLSILSKVKGRQFHESQMYTRIPTTDYFEGYIPESHPYIHYSELGAVAASLAASRGDPRIAEICSILDSLDMPLDMAFEQKGKVHALFEAFIADCNDPNLNLRACVNNPAAVRRRFLYVRPQVKPAFQKEGSPALDPVKSLADPSDIFNRWYFEVYRMVPINNRESKKVVLMECTNADDIYRLAEVVRSDYEAFLASQNGIKVRENEKDVDRYLIPRDLPKFERQDAIVVAESGEKQKWKWFGKKDKPVQRVWMVTNEGMYETIMEVPEYTFRERLELGWNHTKMVARSAAHVCQFSLMSLFMYSSLSPKTYGKIGGWKTMFMMFLLSFFVSPWFGLMSVGTACATAARSICGDWVVNKAELAIQDQLHREMGTLFHLCGIGMNPRTVTTWWARYRTIIGRGLVTLGVVILAYRMMIRKDDDEEKEPEKQSEAKSNFSVENEDANYINSVEEEINCGNSRKRIVVKGQTAWNSMQLETTPCLHQGSPRELANAFSKNVRQVSVMSDIEIRTYIFGLKGGYALINTHALGTDDRPTIRVSNTGRLDAHQFADTKISEENRIDLGNDVTLVCLTGVMFRDVTAHLTEKDYSAKDYDGHFFGRDLRVQFKKGIDHIVHRGKHIAMEGMWTYSFPEHWSGACGLPLVVLKNSGSCIVGIHAGGMKGLPDGFATAVVKKKVLQGMSELEQRAACFPIHSEGCLLVPVEEPAHKSAVRHEVLHGIEYLGKAPGSILINKKSRLSKNDFADEAEEILDDLLPGDYTQYAPPMMVPTKRGGEYISPYNIALRDISSQRKSLDHAVLKKVVKQLTKRIVDGLKTKGVIHLEPLTVHSAINGASEDPFIKRINVRTSAGFGLKGTKEDYLPLKEALGNDVVREPTEELMSQISEVLRCYERGEGSNPVSIAHLKDEPREISKVESGKTRVFYASPLAQLIVARMFLSPFYSLMVEHGDIFCSAVGINPHSGADALVKAIRGFSSKLMEGDYAKYDKSMPVDIGHGASTVVHDVLKFLGYTDRAMRIVRGILTDQLFPIICMLLDLFRCAGLQVSGKYATAEDNTLRGLIMLMYVWYIHPRTKNMDFFTYVLPVLFGDDMLAAVKEAVQAYFNNIVYAAFCKSLFGITFTPAMKSNALTPFMDIETCSFLKRKFIYRADHGVWVGALDPGSIRRSLVWRMPSQSITREEQITATLTSALWELAMHLTEEQHNSVSRKLCQLVSVRVCSGRPVKVPQYSEIWNTVKNPIQSESGTRDNSMVCDPERDNCAVRLSALHTYFREGKPTSCRSARVFCQYCGESTLLFFEGEKTSADAASIPLVYVDLRDEAQERNEDERDGMGTPLNSSSRADRPGQISRVRYFLQDRIAKYEQLVKDHELKHGLLTERTLHRLICTTRHPGLREQYINYRTDHSVLRTLLLTEQRMQRRAVMASAIHAESGEAKSSLSDGPITQLTETENVLDVAGGGFVTQTSGLSKNSQQGQESVLDLGNYLRRPVEIYRTTFSPGDPLFIRLSVWDMYTLDPTVRAKLRNLAYLRANLHARVAISGTPFHYGRVLLSPQPYADYNANLSALLAAQLVDPAFETLLNNYLSQAPGSVVMNVNENVPVEVVFPYISVNPMFRLFNRDALPLGDTDSYDDLSIAGDLFITSLNIVKAISESATPLYLQVYVWLEDVQYGTNTNTVIEITTESGVARKSRRKEDERVSGPVEIVASRVAQVSRALTSVPFIGTFAEASSIMAESVRAVAALFGWSKPVLIQNPQIVKNEPFQNGALTIGTDTNKRIVLDPCQELTVDPRHCGGTEDEMTIDHIASRNTWVTKFNWLDTDPAMEQIFRMLVWPFHATTYEGSKTWVQPSAACFAAQPFAFWRGDITIRFDVVVSGFHRAKIAIAYEPNNHQAALVATNTLDMNKQFIRIVDIQETQTFEITIPWAHHRAWAKVPAPSAMDIFNGLSVSDGEHTNGYITVYPFTELQSPDSSDIEINVFVRCDNLQVNGLTSANMPGFRSEITGGEALIEAESGELFQDNCLFSNEITDIDLNPSTASNERICEEHFGEQPLSFRALLKRYVTVYQATVSADATALPKAISCISPIYPTSQMPFDGGAATGYDLITYLRYAYVGVRGGLRVRPRIPGAGTNHAINATKISLMPPETTSAHSIAIVANATNGSFLEGTVTYMPHVNSGVEAELPFYTNNLFLLSFFETWIPTTPTNSFETSWFRRFKVVFDSAVTSVPATKYTLEYATAEDFSFLRFQGAPLYSLS